MRVSIPTLLTSYTDGAREVEVEAATLIDALKKLDERYPGLRFRVIDEQDRIREHMNLFVNSQRVRAIEGRSLEAGDQIHIIGALSGG